MTLTFLFLALFAACVAGLEHATRGGRLGELRKKAVTGKKLDPETGEKLTDTGAIFCGLLIIFVMMIVAQNFIEITG